MVKAKTIIIGSVIAIGAIALLSKKAEAVMEDTSCPPNHPCITEASASQRCNGQDPKIDNDFTVTRIPNDINDTHYFAISKVNPDGTVTEYVRERLWHEGMGDSGTRTFSWNIACFGCEGEQLITRFDILLTEQGPVVATRSVSGTYPYCV